MPVVRTLAAFIAAAIVTYMLSTAFFTQQVLSQHMAVGASYTLAQMGEAFVLNLTGLQQLGLVLTIALLIGFAVAAVLKRILKPLSPIAYPLAGAAAIAAAILIIENTMAAGGAGAIGGARGPVGLSLQALAGAVGGIVFASFSGRERH